jgi:mRNA interferase YafQ
MMRRGKQEEKLSKVVEIIAAGESLSAKYRDHNLSGEWADRRECHIEPDWLLIYYIRDNDLILERTGTHSDLF